MRACARCKQPGHYAPTCPAPAPASRKASLLMPPTESERLIAAWKDATAKANDAMEARNAATHAFLKDPTEANRLRALAAERHDVECFAAQEAAWDALQAHFGSAR